MSSTETMESRNIKYFNISPNDEAWGIVVTTVGYQQIPPQSPYPRSQHPESHIFNPENGREPDKETGWFEYWVGFKGLHIDKRVENGFFTKKNPVYKIGFSSTIIGLYEDIVNYAMEEKAGYQQIISSIVLYILGLVYFKNRNLTFTDSLAVNKINEARDCLPSEL